MARPQRVHYTFDDYLKLPDDGKRYEIIDGELFVNASPDTGHQFSVGRLHILLDRWVTDHAGGELVLGPYDLHLADDVVVVPDLNWFAPESTRHINALRATGIPDLVVEVLSPGTRARDQGLKADVYARFGAREYWLVDPKHEVVEIRRRRGNRFVRHARGSGEVELVSSLDPRLVAVPARLFRRYGPR